MQQRLGPDVKVEQSCRAAQLTQTEPGPYETGLIGQKQGDRVPLLEPGCSLQSSGHPVALSVHFAIGIFTTLKMQEGLVGMPLRCIQETVHDAVERFDLLVSEEPGTQFDAPEDVSALRAEVREKGVEERQGQDGQPREHGGDPDVHFCSAR